MPDGLVLSLIDPYIGKKSDYKMMQLSSLERNLQDLNQRCSVEDRLFLYEDSAYQGCWGIIGAYKSSVDYSITPDQKWFNVQMAQLRIEIEHAFAIYANT